MEPGESKAAKKAKPQAKKAVGKATAKKRTASKVESKGAKEKKRAIEFVASSLSSSSAAATTTVGAGAERFSEVVDRLKLEVHVESLLSALRTAQGLHDARCVRDATYKRTGLTRTSLLLGMLQVESVAGGVLLACGLKAGLLLLDVGLAKGKLTVVEGKDYQRGDSTDFRVHPNVVGAIESFAETWPALRLTDVGLAWGMLSAREGSFFARVQDTGLDVTEATRRLEKMLEDSVSAVGAPRMAGIVADRAEGRDSLSLARDYRAMASVIASSQPIAPLAIGIFGHWGSGKSFFMQKIQEEVSRRAKRVREERQAAKKRKENEPKLPFVGEVVHVRFNAWHYMDSNLWPNLVVNIFDGLAEHISPGDADAGRERLLRNVGAAQEELRCAQERVCALASQEKRATEARDALKGNQDTASQVWSKEALDLARQLSQELGTTRGRDPAVPVVPPGSGSLSRSSPLDEIDSALAAGRKVVEELSGLRNVFRAFRSGAVPGVSPWVLPVVGGLVTAGWLAYPELVEGVDWLQGGFLRTWAPHSTFLTGLAAAFSKVSGHARRVRKLAERVEARREKMHEQMPARLSKLRRDCDEAEERIRLAHGELREAEGLLHEMRSGRQLQKFLQERSQCDDYRKSLGMIAQVRTDFERLEKILDGSYSNTGVLGEGGAVDSTPVGRVERIVLYIDDLDRCPSGRVLEVIQAVHLLLATKLFVVLVAIDPRWLKKAFSGGDGQSGHWLRLDGEGVCAEDYLEKIFQVPYALPPMGHAGFGELIAHLTGATQAGVTEPGSGVTEPGSGVLAVVGGDGSEGELTKRPLYASAIDQSVTLPEAAATGTKKVGGSGDGGPEDSSVEDSSVEDSSAEDSSVEDLLTTAPAELTKPERVYLARFGPPLVRTPRATKRLVNSYRFVRATLDHRELVEFLRVGEGGAEFMAVIALLALTVGRAKDAGVILATVEGRAAGSLRDVLKDDEVWEGFAAALQPLQLGSEFLEAAAPRVRRYSFAVAVAESEAAAPAVIPE